MLKLNFDQVESVIREVADEFIMPRFGHLHFNDIHFKKDDDPVTIADEEAEIALSTRLLGLLEGSKVVGEEAFAANPSVLDAISGDSPVWIIDPLDGTKAFVAQKPCFGVIVSLALQNQTLAGWLYDPTSREFISAEKGSGAHHKGQKLSVLAPANLTEMSGILGRSLLGTFEDHGKDRPYPTIHRMLSCCHDYASMVVSKPHFAQMFDKQIHFHATHKKCTPWDMSAGTLIHEESGGYSAHWNGDPFRPGTYGRGILDAPDKESWHEIKRWVTTFCTLSE